MKKDAFIDNSKKYRYMLMRQWNKDETNFVNFIMLNPSTADDKTDDPTIKSCIKLAQNWKFDGLYVTNLFALRSTDPKKLKTTKNPIGKENNKFIKKYASLCKLVVIAWGNKGTLFNRDKEVIKLLNKIPEIHCIKKTKTGHPIHPLYTNRKTIPIKF